jgi:hypothetical protein
VDGGLKDRILNGIGNGIRLLREAGPDPLYTPYSFAELTDIVVRDRLINELKAVVDDLDALDPQGLPLLVEDDEFLELLVNHVRNEVISYQSFICKTLNVSFKSLSEKLDKLKKNYEVNFDEISNLENKLREINDAKIRSVLEKNPNFDTLNGERVTPFFLKMAKGSLQESSLNDICDYNGQRFNSLDEQKKFI